MDRFHFDGEARGFERGFIVREIAAQTFQPREIRVACHLARFAQALHIRNGFFQHAAFGFERSLLLSWNETFNSGFFGMDARIAAMIRMKAETITPTTSGVYWNPGSN
ncbi:MAG: hypothetical protein U0X92_03925 [Anaerolineales bacterium]